MSDKKQHQINLCLIGFAGFIFLLLCMLQFIYALLWLLLCVLVVALLARSNHPTYRVEREVWTVRWKKLQDARAQRKREYDKDHRYQNEFVMDRMLVGIGDHAGEKYFIDKENFVIGTQKGCDCVLGKRTASTISGKHCVITYRKHSHAYYIEDLHSLNGTYLGTKRLEPNTPEKLLDNAEITIGRSRFCFVRRK